jgi:hypothetical protein
VAIDTNKIQQLAKIKDGHPYLTGVLFKEAVG